MATSHDEAIVDSKRVKMGLDTGLIIKHIAHTLGIYGFQNVINQLQTGDHIVALKVINQKLFCSPCRALIGQYPRDKMQINRNSKRSIHQALFWIKLLGVNYPINDFLINHDAFVNGLKNVCSYGITTTTGHSSNKYRICINPTHYYASSVAIRTALYDNIEILIENMAVINLSPQLAEFLHMIRAIKDKSNVFQIIELIRTQCPPTVRDFSSEILDVSSLYDGSHYKMVIDTDVGIAIRTTEVRVQCNDMPFWHYCNSDSQPSGVSPPHKTFMFGSNGTSKFQPIRPPSVPPSIQQSPDLFPSQSSAPPHITLPSTPCQSTLEAAEILVGLQYLA